EPGRPSSGVAPAGGRTWRRGHDRNGPPTPRQRGCRPHGAYACRGPGRAG
ncbi:MAG: hypothetical protein AVDCRST_MAG77-3208, partial [uncultured Chloroflexi bacterium]